MGSDIALGSASANNLLSIKNTQSLVDKTSLRLATGLEVNSALDNPSSFFGSRTLQSRAGDLQRLLDGIAVAIRSVQQATIGVDALSQLTQQAHTIAQSASDTISSAERVSAVEGNVDLSDVADITDLSGVNVGDQIFFSTNSLTTVNITPPALSITIAAGTSGNELVKQINDLNTGLPFNFLNASLTEEGFLRIETGTEDFPVGFTFVSSTPNDANNLDLARALGFSEQAQLRATGFGTNEVQFTLSTSNTLRSFQLFEAATNEAATKSSVLSQLEGPADGLIFFSLDSTNDIFEIGINNENTVSIAMTSNLTVGGFIEQINGSSLGGLIEADFDEETSQITIEAVDFSVESIQTSFTSDGLAAVFFGFNISPSIYFTGSDEDSVFIGTFDDETLDSIRSLETDFNNVLEAITEITQDTSFKGVNLLAGDSLNVFFNEDLSNRLSIEGTNFGATNLGLEEASFRTVEDIEQALARAEEALQQVRQFGIRLANNFSIVETRETFTNSTINTLLAGADDLVQADLNEEGAILLALQTRQELATTALSLASQQQENIFTLF
nr:hypothetical protein [Cytophagales bacterium]